jgi:hypothetical protein
MVGESDCEAFAGGAGDRYLKTVDPGAFDEDRSLALCQKIQAGEPLSRQRFGYEVCRGAAIVLALFTGAA